MPHLPLLKLLKTKTSVTESFLGYNHNLKIRSGEFYHMENLTSSCYPLLASREKRGVLCKLESPAALAGRSRLIWIDSGKLFIDGEDVTGEMQISDGEKQLVSMGAYLLIFPDKLYINCEKPSDCGSIEAEFKSTEPVAYTLCSAAGADYGEIPVSAAQPENPQNGDMWIDSSNKPHSLKMYSSANEMWVQQEAVYVKIACPGIGADFQENDAVEIAGSSGSEEVSALNGSYLIERRGEDFIMVRAMISEAFTQTEGCVEICRKMPHMDFVTEAENRLWGCSYGMVNGESVNEIYACALGDFKNWNRFQGLADDSYRASVGSDGCFTAACTHMGYPIFFKENCLHKVYISASGAHRIADSACQGVQQGSHKSLALIGEKLYYKSPRQVCVYEGSLPRGISQALGEQSFHSAVGGSLGDKYYLSMLSEEGESNLFVFDSRYNFWHREDDLRALAFASVGAELYCIDEDSGELLSMTGQSGEQEEEVSWQALSGIMGYDMGGRKYLGRLVLRLKLPQGSSADVFIEYDSDGVFHHAAHIMGQGTGSFSIPVRPRRCDHFRLKITGKGEFRLYSLSKVVEEGSEY